MRVKQLSILLFVLFAIVTVGLVACGKKEGNGIGGKVIITGGSQ